nr:hypothetical protein [Gemmatimonadota bacterium]
MKLRLLVVPAVALVSSAIQAQETAGRVLVQVRSEAGPVERAEVRSGAILVRTNPQGDATLQL